MGRDVDCMRTEHLNLVNCEVCNTPFKPRSRVAKYCSVVCKDRRNRYVTVKCIVCKKTKQRARRGSRDSNMCCSRECGFIWLSFLRGEVSALKRIAANVKKHFAVKTKPNYKLANEIRSLKLMGAKNKARRLCKWCGDIVYTKYVFLHPRCRESYQKKKKAEYKKTDAHKTLKKASRLKRKALQRGATVAHPINPIHILDRDKWRCYLCGIRTPKSLRGSIEDNAPEVDHVIPLSKGGLHVDSNLRCSCRKCNIKKSDQIYQLI